MLTDYHVHLRPDDAGRAAPSATSPPPTPSATARPPSERGIAELGVSEHVYRFRQALDVWQPPVLGASTRATTSTPTARSCASETDLRLGHRGRLRPRPRGPHGEPARGARLGLRDRLGALPRATAPSTSTTTTSGTRRSRPSEVWRRYFETLGEAARSGLFDILAHPDLVKVWGARAPAPGRRPAPLLRARDRGHRRVRRRGRGLDRRPAQAGRRDLPGAARSWRCASRPACPVALSSDAHVARARSATATTQALELLDDARRERARACSSAASGAGADRSAHRRMSVAHRHRLRLHRLARGPAR